MAVIEERLSTPTGRRVAVVGGGWAGLAAAVEATMRGHRVTVFEMAPQFGGRARAVTTDGLVLDNGQHILIGAYRDTLRLMQTVGVATRAAFLRTPLRLVYADGTGLRLGSGPPALAFAAAVWRLEGWTLRERLALLASAASWAARGFRCRPGLSVGLLVRHLPTRVRQELIDPLCVAALNTPSQEASAEVFLRVMKDALLSGVGSADLLLPRVDLGQLLPAPATAWLQHAGATLRPGTRVVGIAAEASGWRVDIGDGATGDPGRSAYDHVVIACAPKEGARLLQTLAPDWSRMAAALAFEPIATVYLQIRGARLSEPMLVLREDDESPAQFVFDRGQLGGPAGLLAFVVSGAAGWVARGTPAIEAAVCRQAFALLGPTLAAEAGRCVTLIEKRATFRCTPGLARPGMRIAPGLSAAGDHVEGPYPATLEGAVRSGIAAAREIDASKVVAGTSGTGATRLDAGSMALSGARKAPPAARR